ncbi:DUF481 domain-containing protein [Mucilaginibacter sp.]
MKQFLILIIITLIAVSAHAQFTDTTHYHLNVAASGSINNTDDSRAYLLNNALSFGIKKKDFTLTSANTWVYGKQNNQLTNNDYSSSLVFNLYKTFPHFYYWGLLNYNTSYSLKINNQVLAGGGIAYSFIDQKNTYINLSDGILYDQSDLVIINNYHTFRNSLRLQFHFASNIFTLDGSNFLQNSLSRGNDYIIRTTTTLGVKLRKWISLTTALNYNKMTITQSDNLIFTYGLTIDKYF